MNVDKAIEAGHAPVVDVTHPVDTDSETLSANAQEGVRRMQATTQVWTKSHLIAAYVMMWIITFVDYAQGGTSGNLTPYVTSAFEQHSLTSYTYVMSGVIGGVLKLPLAKILDIFGRPQGYALSVGLIVLGLIMMAACNNVQTFAAAQIFYSIGSNGLSYTLSIFAADTSHLKNRGFMYGFISSPYLITMWISGPIADAFLKGPGWRWSFGMWAIVTTVVCAPLYILFTINYKKAIKAGIIVPVKSSRTFKESVRYYIVEFDAGGLFLLLAGLVLFLLPFSLYSYQEDQWRSALVISMLVIGGLLLIAFVFYEKYVAPKSFIPYQLLLDRTVLGACILAGVLFLSFYIWRNYFTSFLQVVNGLSIIESNYVVEVYGIGSCISAILSGIAIRWSGRFKWIALYLAVPLQMLGIGLMIHFRRPDVNIGFIIMTQIFISFAGGALVITEQIAAMAATDHQHVAVVIALETMFSNIGGGIGSSIAAAVWTGVFPKRLMELLPEDSLENFASIYGDLSVQLSYPKGSPTRIAIEQAYSDAQKWMNLGGLLFITLALPAVMAWRNIKVKDFKQVKGLVA
ncbi:siderophore iron transporter [Aaosphaeria arxii CBS 175.79]|uniref:Siderophore iron transporter n=1 Tax=Aaosphaeria arxii CBS 175.79 TaxID=1450172 RepID=A0A6A5Y7R3_9PLEO|nr:siderophore iron transporter [Aaosphaeria arxii CBS 175.79]KAF2021612.1 siderophore iron transporter [Aaosphaeria arxii CBS 175.79]